MNSNVYDIDYGKVVNWLLPARIRKVKIFSFLMVMVSGVVFLYQDLLRFRIAKQYQLMITPQVCYLRRLLNDRYDYTQRRIRIVDSVERLPVYFYRRDENKPVYLFKRSENQPVYLFTRGEAGLQQDDFVVLVPSSIAFDTAEMTSLIKAYKLAGTRFKIQRT